MEVRAGLSTIAFKALSWTSQRWGKKKRMIRRETNSKVKLFPVWHPFRSPSLTSPKMLPSRNKEETVMSWAETDNQATKTTATWGWRDGGQFATSGSSRSKGSEAPF